MALIKEPKNVDLSTKSKPWTDEELSDFRTIIKEIKVKNTKRKDKSLLIKSRKQVA